MSEGGRLISSDIRHPTSDICHPNNGDPGTKASNAAQNCER